MEAFREGLVVCRHELAQVLRSGRAVALAIVTTLGALLSAAVFVGLNKALLGSLEELAPDDPGRLFATEAVAKGLAWLVGGDEDTARALTAAQVPPLMLFSFWLSRLLLPLLAVLLAHDAIAREVGTRSIRFVALRARRGAILLGKAAAQLLVLLALIVLGSAVVLCYGLVQSSGFAIGPGLLFALRTFAAVALPGAAYLAVTLIASSIAQRGGSALLLAVILILGLWLGGIFARAESLRFLGYALPSHYEKYLLASTVSGRLAGLAGYLGLTATYLAAAYALLRRRDL